MAVPAIPFRGIQPFRYEDHAIFFGRESEGRMLASLVTVYRGVFLYGDSGNGKSSLVNAGLLPRTRDMGFEAVRVRVQPRTGEELVVDRVAIARGHGGERQPAALFPDDAGSSRTVLSIAEFEARMRACSGEYRPLIVFDQFEEILTLFADEEALESRRRLAAMIGRLLRDPIPVKLVFAFREDYLGGVKELLDDHPELVDQALRLGPLDAGDLEQIIRGPFERFPGQFERELDAVLARRLVAELQQRFGTGEVSLSEVQTVCLRLWRSPDPDRLLAERGIQGLLEDELGEALAAFSPELRAAAVALLSQMVTSAGTRNVVSAEDLRLRVHDADDQIAPDLVDQALERLEREAKLVRRERRRDIDLFEITSEFLVPWISQRREELRRAQDRRREHRRLRILGAIAGALLVLLGLMAGIAVWALSQRSAAQREAAEATSLALATSSVEPLGARPDISLALAYEAYRARPRPEASSAVVRALLAARTSRLRGVLTDAGSLGAAAFSPDGRRLASIYGSTTTLSGFVPADDTVRVWDLDSGARRRLAGHTGPLFALAFSPDGKVLATAGVNEIRTWNPATGASLGRLLAPRSSAATRISAIGFGPGARTLLTAHDDGSVRVWDLRTYEPIRRIPPPADWSQASRALGFSPDGTAVATADDGFAAPDSTIVVRTLATGRQVRLRGLAGSLGGALFSADGSTLASSDDDGSIAVWRTDSGHRLARFRASTYGVQSVAISPDGRTIASADGSIRLWSAGGKELARFANDTASAVAFSPDGKTVASNDGSDAVRLWDARARRPDRLPGSVGQVSAVAFSPRGSALATAGGRAAALWDPDTGRQRDRLPDQPDDVADVAFSADGREVATAGHDRTIRLWKPFSRAPTVKIRSPEAVMDVAFAPDGKTIAAATLVAPDEPPIAADSRARLWDVATGSPIAEFGDGSQVVAFSPDGKMLASGSLDSTVHLWSTATHKQLRPPLRGHGAGVTDVAFSPDGRTLISSGADGAILLWNPRTAVRLGRLTGHAGSVNAIAVSPDGKTLASAGEDGTVRLWNLATGRQTARIGDWSNAATDVAFSADGRTLAATGRDGGVRLWHEILWRNPSELHESVCDVLLAGLHRPDWDRYAAGIPYRRTCP